MPDLTLPAGTGDQTPNGTTDAGSAAQPAQPTVEQLQQQLQQERQQAEFWKARHGASTTEAQRLYQENIAFKQRQAAAAAEPQAPSKTLTQAMLDGDESAVNSHMQVVQHRAEQSALARMNEAVNATQREQALAAFVAAVPGMNDPNSGIAQQVLQQYEAIKNDPRYSFLDRTEQPLSNGSAVAPAVLAAAVDRVMGRIEQSANSTRQTARRGLDSFVEPQGGGRFSSPGSHEPATDGKTPILSARELDQLRVTARIDRISLEDAAAKHWRFMNADEKARRIRSGRAD